MENTSILFKGLKKKTGKWSTVASKLREMRLRLKATKLAEKDLTLELIKLSDGVGCYDKNGYALKPFMRKGAIDYKLIKQLEDLDLEPFRRESSEQWKFDQLK